MAKKIQRAYQMLQVGSEVMWTQVRRQCMKLLWQWKSQCVQFRFDQQLHHNKCLTHMSRTTSFMMAGFRRLSNVLKHLLILRVSLGLCSWHVQADEYHREKEIAHVQTSIARQMEAMALLGISTDMDDSSDLGDATASTPSTKARRRRRAQPEVFPI